MLFERRNSLIILQQTERYEWKTSILCDYLRILTPFLRDNRLSRLKVLIYLENIKSSFLHSKFSTLSKSRFSYVQFSSFQYDAKPYLLYSPHCSVYCKCKAQFPLGRFCLLLLVLGFWSYQQNPKTIMQCSDGTPAKTERSNKKPKRATRYICLFWF